MTFRSNLKNSRVFLALARAWQTGVVGLRYGRKLERMFTLYGSEMAVGAAAVELQVADSTVRRWLVSGKLIAGYRKGAVTVESVAQLMSKEPVSTKRVVQARMRATLAETPVPIEPAHAVDRTA